MPWAKGESGNPQGKRRGVRDKMQHATLKALADAWRKYGPDALARAAAERPAEFAAIYARLLPKDVQHNHLHELSAGFRAALLAAQHTRASVGEVIEGDAETIPDAKLLTDKDNG